MTNFEDCSACGLCVAGCQAHQKTGREELTAQGRNLALQEGVSRDALEENIGACTLSGYCTAICPRGVDNEAVWFALRRQRAPEQAMEKLERFHLEGSLHGPLPPLEARRGAPLFLGCHLRGPGHALLPVLEKALDAAGLQLGFPSEEPCCGEAVRELGFETDKPGNGVRPAYLLETSCQRAFPRVPSLWDTLLARTQLFTKASGKTLHVGERWLNASPRSRWPLLERVSERARITLRNVDAFHLASGQPPEPGDIVMESSLVSADNPWLMEFIG